MLKVIKANIAMVEGDIENVNNKYSFSLSAYNSDGEPEKEMTIAESFTEFVPFSEAFLDAVERLGMHLQITLDKV
jgi:hypothetical protein